MDAKDILNNTDPNEIRNVLKRLKLTANSNRAVPNIVINQAPSQYVTTLQGEDLGWFNVKDYGALGDGVADDTAAINNAIGAINTATKGLLYFPAGTYLCSAGLTAITANVKIMGCGNGSSGGVVSRVTCTSSTAFLFTISGKYARFEHIALYNSASTPSAGAGIYVPSGTSLERVEIYAALVYGFYVNIRINLTASNSAFIDECVVLSPVLYGIRIQSSSGAVEWPAEWTITRCHIHAGLHNSTAGVRVEGPNAGRILNCLIGLSADLTFFSYGIDLAFATGGSHFVIANNMISGVSSHGIRAVGPQSDMTINGNQFGISYLSGNNTGNAINIDNVDYITVSDNVFRGGSTPVAVALANVDNATIVGNINHTFSALVSQSSCTNVVIVEPASSVVTETAYGQSSAVGTSGYYARQDHTHGTPPEPVTSLAKSGESALTGTVTLSQGTGITLSQVGQDIEIASTSAGKYRLFIHVDDGAGGFNWVVSGGRPVTALYGLE